MRIFENIIECRKHLDMFSFIVQFVFTFYVEE